MPKTIKEERLRWVLPIYNKEVKLKDAAKVCPYSQRSLERWISLYKKYGEEELIPKSTRPKTNPKETSIRVKERVIELRKEKKECALKIKWDLKDENINIHERTVGKILKTEGLVRKYRIKRVKYKYIRSELKPGEIIEIDVKYVPGKVANKQYYQYTAIDLSSRWRHMEIYDEQSNCHSVKFLEKIIRKAPFEIRAVKTDNHSTFTNRYTGYLKSADPFNPKLHYLDKFCAKNKIIHYLIDPGKPAQNGTVERSHGSDQRRLYSREKFASIDELKYRVRLWNMYYNDLRHCSLNGKSPNQFLENYNLIKIQRPTKECA
ncbi:MAG: DDE-type integrase/transposase/recombinase [Patescibacteria group bacterium]|nr:DDE-type integrase/transposase/recombinase [Patescibacteria group bacterium]